MRQPCFPMIGQICTKILSNMVMTRKHIKKDFKTISALYIMFLIFKTRVFSKAILARI